MDYKANQAKKNKALTLTSLAVIAVLIIIYAVTSIANQRPNPQIHSPSTTSPDVSEQETAPVVITPPVTDDSIDVNVDIPEETKPVEIIETEATPVVVTPTNQLPTFIAPVSGTISKYHDSEIQVYSVTMNDHRVHLGLDIASTLGAPVLAAADGVIANVWDDPMMGICIEITHSGDAKTVYKNLAPEIPASVAQGAPVKAGAVIGAIGDTAMIEIAEEPHLHFEMVIADVQVCPLDYISEASQKTSFVADTHYEG